MEGPDWIPSTAETTTIGCTADRGGDTLYGDNGNDTLDGGSNDDIMFGGRNDDTYIVREAGGDVVVEHEGRDTVFSNLGDYPLPANVEDPVLEYGVINGTGNDLRNQIVGTEDANTIFGMGDNDTSTGWVAATT